MAAVEAPVKLPPSGRLLQGYSGDLSHPIRRVCLWALGPLASGLLSTALGTCQPECADVGQKDERMSENDNERDTDVRATRASERDAERERRGNRLRIPKRVELYVPTQLYVILLL